MGTNVRAPTSLGAGRSAQLMSGSLEAQLGPVVVSAFFPRSDSGGTPNSREGLTGLVLLLGGDARVLPPLQLTSSA